MIIGILGSCRLRGLTFTLVTCAAMQTRAKLARSSLCVAVAKELISHVKAKVVSLLLLPFSDWFDVPDVQHFGAINVTGFSYLLEVAVDTLDSVLCDV